MTAAAVVACAVALSAGPAIDGDQARLYAGVLRTEAAEHGFDPLVGAAIIWHESRWHQHAISRDGEDVGLAQIRARFIGACRDDPDPADPGRDCLQTRVALQDGEHNIRTMGGLIGVWRKRCLKETGTATVWLRGYVGQSDPQAGMWCGRRKGKALPLPKSARSIQRHRDWLAKCCATGRRSSAARCRSAPPR